MHVTSLFLENFFGGFSMSLSSIIPSSSVLSSSLTTTELSATGVGVIGTNSMDESPILGTSSISAAITTASSGFTATKNTSKQLELTQAYIESMDESELEEFIECLEQVETQENSQEIHTVQK